MNISYNWLKRYIALNDSAEEVAKILTSIGLEVGKVEKVQTIKGGLEGLVVGEVITCVDHPNSDHLHITTTRVAPDADPLQMDNLMYETFGMSGDDLIRQYRKY